MGARRRIGAERSCVRVEITPGQARGRSQDRLHFPSPDVGAAGAAGWGGNVELRDGDDVGVVGDPVRPQSVAPRGGDSGYLRPMVEVGRRRMRGDDPRLRHALQIEVAEGRAVVDGHPPVDDGDGDASSARAAGGARRVSRAGADQPQAGLDRVFGRLPGTGRSGVRRRLQGFRPVGAAQRTPCLGVGECSRRRVRTHRRHRRRARRRRHRLRSRRRRLLRHRLRVRLRLLRRFHRHQLRVRLRLRLLLRHRLRFRFRLRLRFRLRRRSRLRLRNGRRAAPTPAPARGKHDREQGKGYPARHAWISGTRARTRPPAGASRPIRNAGAADGPSVRAGNPSATCASLPPPRRGRDTDPFLIGRTTRAAHRLSLDRSHAAAGLLRPDAQSVSRRKRLLKHAFPDGSGRFFRYASRSTSGCS